MKPTGAGVLYLLANKFELYTNSLPEILEFHFSDTVQDLNLINKELLIREIVAFITVNKIIPNNLIIVISDEAAWTKDLQPTEVALTQNVLQEQIKPFIEKNPYAHAANKTVTTPNGIKLFVTNQDIYLTVKEAFEQKDFSVEYIFPGCIFSNNISAAPDLTIENAGLVFKEALTKKDDNFLISPQTEQEELVNKAQRKKDIMRMYALVNVFGILIIAVVVAWHRTNFMPSQDYRGKAAPNQTITPIQTLLPSAEETKELTMQIVSNKNSSQKATQIHDLFRKYNFKNLVETTEDLPSQRTDVIVFSDKPTTKVRNAVLIEVKRTLPQVVIQEKNDAAFDITVILKQ